MHIEQLKYFLSVVEHGSVNSVANTFFMTPQAINASLRKLEAEFDSPLLIRSKKGVTLTPQGMIFAEWAKNLLNQYEKMQLVLTAYNNESSTLSGTLSVFSASVFTDTFLPSMVRNFTQLFPNTTLKIMTVNANEILTHLFNGYCHVAFLSAGRNYLTHAIEAHEEQNIKVLELASDTLVFCTKPGHPFTQYANVSYLTLSEYIQNSNNPVSFYHVLGTNSEWIAYPKAISDSDSAELHKKLMLENNVITCMPKLAYQHSFQNDGFTAISTGEPNAFIHAIVYRDDDTLQEHALIQQFVHTLTQQFRARYKN
jgi:DNA-binding transcriptional LysR family regulator